MRTRGQCQMTLLPTLVAQEPAENQSEEQSSTIEQKCQTRFQIF